MAEYLSLFLLIGLVCFTYGGKILLPELPEVKFNVSQMANYYGYPCERYEVTTEDGYILTLHRIPHGRNKKASNGYPVFLQHGILDTAATYTMNLPKQSLAFILADAGYDVWLGNSRGNTYSTRHVKYTIKDKQFWDFSFEEMAKFDLPASIDFVLKTTNHKDLYYVGHSQGTTIGFIEFGRNKDLSKKIKTFFALAPVATVGSIKGAIKVLSHITPEIKFFTKLFGIREFLPSAAYSKFLAQAVCGTFRIFEKTCGNVVFLMAGFDKKELNETRLPIYLSHLPAGTSVKDVIHFAQMVKSGKFQMYDYGETDNTKNYGQAFPPQYNVSSVEVPVALYYGGKDWLADPTDVERYLLPNLHNKIAVEYYETYDHLDFVWGIDANTHIYSNMLKLMDSQR